LSLASLELSPLVYILYLRVGDPLASLGAYLCYDYVYVFEQDYEGCQSVATTKWVNKAHNTSKRASIKDIDVMNSEELWTLYTTTNEKLITLPGLRS